LAVDPGAVRQHEGGVLLEVEGAVRLVHVRVAVDLHRLAVRPSDGPIVGAVARDLVAARGGDRLGVRVAAQPARVALARRPARLAGAAALRDGLEQLARALEDLAGAVQHQVLVHALGLQGALAALDLRAAHRVLAAGRSRRSLRSGRSRRGRGSRAADLAGGRASAGANRRSLRLALAAAEQADDLLQGLHDLVDHLAELLRGAARRRRLLSRGRSLELVSSRLGHRRLSRRSPTAERAAQGLDDVLNVASDAVEGLTTGEKTTKIERHGNAP